jgi:hypothetical protein
MVMHIKNRFSEQSKQALSLSRKPDVIKVVRGVSAILFNQSSVLKKVVSFTLLLNQSFTSAIGLV